MSPHATFAPRIAIAAGAQSRSEPYEAAIRQAGADPVVVRPGATGDGRLDGLAGLVLAGGPDVAPWRLQEELPPELRTVVQVDEERDEMEWTLLERAERERLPVLAICRGVQVVNAYAGGTLHLDLVWAGFTAIDHRQRDRRQEVAHEVRLADEGRVRGTAGSARLGVNSLHHQAIREVAPDLRAVAWSDDGLVEAVESRDGRIVGVQWHPEALCGTSAAARNLFADLLSRAAAPA
ncbi:MAG: gamma-glutamyl-gamma-aminobutyrate hydrolase family protein [Candidatus Dormiibacterota bacterium]